MIKAKSDFGKVALEFKAYGKGVDKATRSAINSVASQGKTQSSKIIRSEYNIKAKDVNKTMSVNKASLSRSVASIVVKGVKAISLGKFSPTQTKRGVNVRIKKGGTKKLVKGAFKATMPSGHQGVFRRKSVKSLPIKDQFAIGVPVMFKAKSVMPKVQRFIYEKFPTILKSKLDYFNK